MGPFLLVEWTSKHDQEQGDRTLFLNGWFWSWFWWKNHECSARKHQMNTLPALSLRPGERERFKWCKSLCVRTSCLDVLAEHLVQTNCQSYCVASVWCVRKARDKCRTKAMGQRNCSQNRILAIPPCAHILNLFDFIYIYSIYIYHIICIDCGCFTLFCSFFFPLHGLCIPDSTVPLVCCMYCSNSSARPFIGTCHSPMVAKL